MSVKPGRLSVLVRGEASPRDRIVLSSVRKIHRFLLIVVLMGLVAATAATSAIAADDGLGSEGLLAYWPFDEGNGTVASDVTGNGFDGTVHRTVWTDDDDGVCGSALEFFGKDIQFTAFDQASYVETPFRLPPVTDVTEFTLTAWFETETQKMQAIMGYFTSTDLFVTLLNHQVTNDVHFNLRDTAFNRNLIEVTTTPGLLGDDEWHHIAFRRKTTSELDIYIDGVVQPKTVLFDNVLNNYSQRADWFIGGINDVNSNALQFNFNGTLDEIKIYDHALSDEEIAAEFDEPCIDDDDDDDDDDGDEVDDG